MIVILCVSLVGLGLVQFSFYSLKCYKDLKQSCVIENFNYEHVLINFISYLIHFW